jgi:ATP-dependent DNA helicase 2 subunit 1
MGDVFSTCNWVLRDGYARVFINSSYGFNTPFSAPKAATKRVFLVTDEDDPHNGHVHMDTVAHNLLEVSLFYS